MKRINCRVKILVMRRDNFQCCDCHTEEDLTVHHIISREDGGTDDPENLRTLCDPCHCIYEKLRAARKRRRVLLKEFVGSVTA